MTGAGGQPVANFESLFHQAPCGYLITDDDGHIAAVNDTFVRWTGYNRAELLGKRLQSLLPVGDQILYATHCIPQLGITGSVSEIALDIIGSDGVRHPALLTASRFAATGQEPDSVRVIIFSAHERRLYEKELVSALRAAEESDARRALAEQELQRLALHDSLTGLPNRAGLKARFGEAPPDSAIEGNPLGALFIDLDHFKAVNDSLGHGAGDNLLVSVAGRLAAAVQAPGAVARLSGDEFVVVDTVAGTEEAAALAARLLDVIAAPIHLEDLEIVTSASIGIAVARAGDDTLEDLIRRADIAMYRAKERGRNRWELHRPAASDPAVDRLRALGELRRGIGEGALRVHYQPRIDLHTGRASGVEALVRWQHPTRGLLPPSEFIAMAEESGLVRPLGAWVLDETLKLAESLRRDDRHGAGLEFAVNLSARQLNDPGLVDMVESALERRNLDPALLLLEITETALMSDPGAAVESLAALKNLGVGLAVDDFGTGYSSLTYLKKFPINELKIDRSFIMGLGLDSGDAAIVGSCIDLAHAVGIRAVAEGVETSGQAQTLQDMGCDLAQGYLFARPLPEPRLREWLASHT
ncbi:diguanylate cyclase/phosphodiesterase with PAS/PAC sensor(s) [Pseudarthrobacter chlorophenolicus A6]|uniref:Diguanylate cyclase/phosphodiesterase with PAS/PAC sensor(S) n=1 Tax=Pseudarthrobacter chlorophenolicus (strain ATCC 700700 / DSM 12829 / CIP 107037 / JCM 12360 / KCTC 9906 / NCIMB 13794 / A6) TaxID=452863 RepID=B8HDV0_PSECP|nr:GGDEF and EAL domain-containing protein [Pseudarthrobacter chlorophenolicus]ACL40818.1 diguanylate cyclase/phosphodiesterase with PAS/PAC sensor(s) [Pseudarthrobacter chlorophenolicus A6]SDQ74546.1 PAS domain S-box-containing protein/diguanylate cyclase (GGDEF) domain-containing protein [Pseudarthrobacter chlorophenolicus]